MIVQQLGLTKLNILRNIEPNSLPKESRYLKISRNKLIFSGFSRHFGFYPLKFWKGNLRDRQAKFSLFGIFDPNQVSKLGPQKMVTDPKKFSSTINLYSPRIIHGRLSSFNIAACFFFLFVFICVLVSFNFLNSFEVKYLGRRTIREECGWHF